MAQSYSRYQNWLISFWWSKLNQQHIMWVSYCLILISIYQLNIIDCFFCFNSEKKQNDLTVLNFFMYTVNVFLLKLNLYVVIQAMVGFLKPLIHLGGKRLTSTCIGYGTQPVGEVSKERSWFLEAVLITSSMIRYSSLLSYSVKFLLNIQIIFRFTATLFFILSCNQNPCKGKKIDLNF